MEWKEYVRALVGAIMFVFFIKAVYGVHWFYAISTVGFVYIAAFWTVDIHADIKRRREEKSGGIPI